MEHDNQNASQEYISNSADNQVPVTSPDLEPQFSFGFMNKLNMNASQLLPHFGLHRVNAPQPYGLSNPDTSNIFGSSSQGFTTAPTTSVPTTSKTGSKPKKTSNRKKSINQQPTFRCNWSVEEDIALTRAYLYVTTDPIVGNEQSGDTMWERILEAYKNNVRSYDNRGLNSLNCHWKIIQRSVSSFQGYYEGLAKAPPSGTTTADMKREAKYLYEAMEGSSFKFEHCWEIMVENPKWCSLRLNKPSSKKAKVDKDNNSVDARANEEEKKLASALETEYDNEDDRPLGRKSSKENKKRMHDQKAVVDVLCSFQTTLEKQQSANQQSLELRERMLSKEFELKEKSHKLKEEAEKRKEKAEKRKEQERILNTDLNTLQPILRAAYEKMQDQILKEWEGEGLFGDSVAN